MGATHRSVGEVIAGVLRRDPLPDEPLQLDSLEHAEVALALEEAFGVPLPDDADLRTVAAAAAAVGGGSRRPALEVGIGHLQWLAEMATTTLLSRFFRLRVHHPDRVPAHGPVVVAMNHDSLLDIPFLVLATPRRIWFMAKRELYGGRFRARFFHSLGGFPVDRARHDLRAIRAALGVVDAGRALGMYPEGTRTDQLLPFLPGAAWVALRTGVPLVPVGISGTLEAMPRGASFPRRSRVTVRFGHPIDVGKEPDPATRLARARELSPDLREEVRRLSR
jgi:1-acyl-sn-glycerol-3-phosphate acyltransferase